MQLSITQSNLLISALLLGLVGFVECFFGYRFFRIVLAIIGLFVGAGIALALVHTDQTVIMVIAGIIGGVIGAILFYHLYFIGTFLAGLGLGGTVGAIVAANLHVTPEVTNILVIAGAVIGGVLGIIFSKYIIMLSTAFTGAAQIVYALLLLLPGAHSVQANQIQIRFAQPEGLMVTLMILVIGAVGFMFQLNVYRHTPLEPINNPV